nr:EOG090X085S [Eulimnadia texana]
MAHILRDCHFTFRCRDCLSKLPYATFVATILCIVGLGVFGGTFYRASTLTNLIFIEIFHLQVQWVRIVQMTLVILAGVMALVSLVMVSLGWLATGSTRHKVYRRWKARANGKVSSAVFIGISYVFFYVWTAVLVATTAASVIYSFLWGLCTSKQKHLERDCIDFTQFDWLFPNGTRIEDMQVCGAEELKLFCKDYVEIAQASFIISTAAAFVVALSLVHYLMCLTSNYAYIRDHEKIADLHEHYLEHERMTRGDKSRFS